MLEMHFPHHSALPAKEAQCTHLIGTTLLYYTYVHMQYATPELEAEQQGRFGGRGLE